MSKLTIRFVTDYVCPYCIAAKIPLMKAAETRDVEIQWLPYELTTTDKEPVDTWHDEVSKAKWAAGLLPFCEEQGLNVHIPPHVVPRPYTHLAFMGYHYACDHGKGEAYNTRMYELYFGEEKDIGDMKVLRAEAEALGMDGADFENEVLSGKYEARQKEADRYAKEELHVRGVPSIWIGETKVLNALMSAEEYGALIDEIIAGQDAEQADGGAVCGPDGCGEPVFGCGPDGCK